MNRGEIRAAVEVRMAQKGYPPDWYGWAKTGRGGRLHILVNTEAPAGTEGWQVFRLAAPMAKYRFREVMDTIPRHGPARFPRPKITAETWRQPELCLGGDKP